MSAAIAGAVALSGGCGQSKPAASGTCATPTSLPPAATAGANRYGPEGFTQADNIKALLAPHERAPDHGGIVEFSGLSATDASQLLASLPAAQSGDRQNESPTFEQLVALGRTCPTMMFGGYRAMPGRDDERITIDSVEVPRPDVTNAVMRFIRSLHPDETGLRTDAGRRVWYAWWD